VYITGISVGLPGHPSTGISGNGKLFGPLELERLIEGENCIEILSIESKKKLLAKKIVMKRRATCNSTITNGSSVTTTTENIQLAAQMGSIDLVEQYSLPKNLVESMDESTQIAVAAGLEALLNAGLINQDHSCENTTTSKWLLAPEYQETTGIIYATSYPTMASVTSEISRFYETCSKKDYEFDRKFLFRVLVLANAQLAQIIGARGPNTQINAACASTTQAISFAKDWLQLGKCERVIVIASDTASSENLLSWIGGGFQALGAASISPTVEKAALPFDARRNGMIVGAGAVGIVLESSTSFNKRSFNNVNNKPIRVRGVVKLLACYCSNSAYHGASLEVNHVTQEFEKFFTSLYKEYGISKKEFVQNGVYYSHETFTNASATTSCAFVEVEALRRVLGSELIQELMITNTKGFTGHPMGVSFEDVAAIQGLRVGKIPPVANFKQHDPNLNQGQPLRLSSGGIFVHRYALRFAAGFGSQLAFSFYALHQ
jgi:3-oxoacyl-(acyl-carrier-protein) synthase